MEKQQLTFHASLDAGPDMAVTLGLAASIRLDLPALARAG